MAAATQEAEDQSHDPPGDLLAFLERALAVLDENGTRPDLGARIQEMIDELRQKG